MSCTAPGRKCECTKFTPIPLKRNFCQECGHSLVYHDDEDVAATSIHNADPKAAAAQKRESELAPVKRKSVVSTLVPIFNQHPKDETPSKIDAPRRRFLHAPDPDEDPDAAARIAREKEEAMARKKKEEEDELARRLAAQRVSDNDDGKDKNNNNDSDKKNSGGGGGGGGGGSGLLCAHCNKTINGGYMIFPDRNNAKVHNSCQEAFLKANCDKCVHCGEILFPVPGKFKGEFMILGGNEKVHTECYDEYQKKKDKEREEARAAAGGGGGGGGDGSSSSSSTTTTTGGGGKGKFDPCKQCGKDLVGQFLRYPNGDKVHQTCVDAYIEATSEKCEECKGPVAVVAGKFCGQYYIVDDGKKVHSECWDKYQESH